MTRRLAVSFSGGATSGFMRWLIEFKLRDQFDEIVTTFANTGEENEETLEFVRDCDRHFGFGTVWVEAAVDPEHGKGTRHKVVTFETASRRGEPYEAVTQKYGISNMTFQPCNRELKLAPMRSYLRSIGWKAGTYETAIGIRIDEARRAKADAADDRIIYPLIDLWPSDKQDVNDFWDEQPFRLQLKEHQGNCKWCWKKSLSKHMRLIGERPEIYDFPRRMEREYGFNGAQSRDGVGRVFFRGMRSTNDLFALHAEMKSRPQAHQLALDFDRDAGCSESCEVFGT
jgi:hypothetical protein